MTTALSSLRIEATVDASGFETGMQKVVSSSDKGTASVTGFGAAVDKTEAQLAGASDAASVMAKSQDELGAKIAQTEQRLTTSASALDRNKTKWIDNYGAALQYQGALTKLNGYLDSGKVSQEEYDASLKGITARYSGGVAASDALGLSTLQLAQKMAAAEKDVSNLAHAHTALSSQGQEAFHIMRSMTEQLAIGTPITQVFTQHMSQLSYAASGQGGLTSAFGEAISVLGRFITPVTLAAAGAAAVTAAFVGLGIHAEASANSLRQFNQALGETGDSKALQSLNAGSKALQNMGVAAEDANKAMADLARNPIINPNQASQIANVGANVAARLGVSPDQGVKALSDALSGGVEAMIRFGEQLHAIDTAEGIAITIMAQHGQGVAALNRAFGDIANATDKAHSHLSPLTLAVADLRTAWNSLLDIASKPVGWFSEAMIKGLTIAINGLSEALTKVPQGGMFGNAGTLPALSPTQMYGNAGPSSSAGQMYGGTTTALPPVNVNASAPLPVTVTNVPELGAGSGSRFSQNGLNFGSADLQRLSTLLSVASTSLPTGYSIQAQSTVAPRASGTVNHSSGKAVDFYILDANNNVVPGYKGSDTTGLYTQVAINAYNANQQLFPGAPLGSGTQFATVPGGTVRDNMHLDTVGDRATPGFGTGLAALAAQAGTGVAVQSPDAIRAAAKAQDEYNTTLNQTLQVDSQLSGPIARAQQAANSAYNSEMARSQDVTLATAAAQQAYQGSLKETGALATKDAQLADLQIQGQAGIAAAYGQSETAGLKAAAAEQARVEVIEKGGDVGQRTQQILAASAAEALSSSAKQLPVLGQQLTATQNLADAAAKGTAAQHEAELQNQVTAATHDALAKAIASGNPALIAEAQAVTEATAALVKKNDAAQTALQLNQAINNNNNTIQVYQLEASLAGQTTEEINRRVSLLQAQQVLLSKGIDLNGQLDDKTRAIAENYLKSVDGVGRTNIALGDANRNAQQVNSTLTSIGSTIDNDITNNLQAAFSGQKITSWGTLFHQVLSQIEAQLISLAIIKPAIGSVLSFLGFSGAAQSFGSLTSGAGILSGAGGLLGGLGGLFGSSSATGTGTSGNVTATKNSDGSVTFSNLASVGSAAKSGFDLFGGGGGGGTFGGISDFINNKIGAALGFTGSNVVNGTGAGAGIFTDLTTGATSDILGSGVSGGLFGSTLTGALGLAGLGGTAGSLFGLLTGNTGIGSTIAGGAGGFLGGLGGSAILGPLLGAAGGPIGAILGGILGNVVGGLFGGKPANNASSGSVNLASGSLGAFSSGGVAANDQAAQSILGPISQTISQINSILGASIIPDSTLIAQAGTRDGVKAVLRNGQGAQTFTASSPEDLTNQIAQYLYQHIDTSKLGATLAQVVSGLTLDQLKDPNALQAAAQAAKDYDALSTALDQSFAQVESATNTVGPFATAMANINSQASALRQEFSQFGLAVDKVDQAVAQATTRLQGDFRKAVDQAFNAASGSGFLNDIQTAIQNYSASTQEAAAIGLGDDQGVGNELGQTFNASIGQILSSLNTSQLDQVVATFGQLGYSDLPAMAKAARDAAAATDQATLALNRQAFVSQTQDQYDSSIGSGFLGQLRALDATAHASLAQGAALGFGADSAQAAQIQQTEHLSALTILQGLNNDQLEQARSVLADLNPAFASWVDEAKNATQAANDAAAAQQRSNDILAAGLQIRQYLNSLDTVTPSAFTSPESRLQSAQSQYSTQLTAAQGGDVTALQGITAIAQTFLNAETDYNASNATAQAAFEQVKKDLAALPGVPNATQTQTNAIVGAITTTGDNSVSATNANTTTTSASAAQIISTTISANADLVNVSRSNSADIVDAANKSAAATTATAISVGNDIVKSAAQSMSALTGATTVSLDGLTTATVSGDAAVTAAANQTATATIAGTAATQGGALALLASNVANAKTLLDGSKTDTLSLLKSQGDNANAILTAEKAQSLALIDQNTAGAKALIDTTNVNAATAVTQNTAASQAIISTAKSTSALALSSANDNTKSLVAQTLASAALITSQNAAATTKAIISAQTGTASLITANNVASAAALAEAQLSADKLAGKSDTAASAITKTAAAGTAALLAQNAADAKSITAANASASAAIATATAAGTAAIADKTVANGVAVVTSNAAQTAALLSKTDATTAALIAGTAADAKAQGEITQSTAASIAAATVSGTAAIADKTVAGATAVTNSNAVQTAAILSKSDATTKALIAGNTADAATLASVTQTTAASIAAATISGTTSIADRTEASAKAITAANAAGSAAIVARTDILSATLSAGASADTAMLIAIVTAAGNGVVNGQTASTSAIVSAESKGLAGLTTAVGTVGANIISVQGSSAAALANWIAAGDNSIIAALGNGTSAIIARLALSDKTALSEVQAIAGVTTAVGLAGANIIKVQGDSAAALANWIAAGDNSIVAATGSGTSAIVARLALSDKTALSEIQAIAALTTALGTVGANIITVQGSSAAALANWIAAGDSSIVSALGIEGKATVDAMGTYTTQLVGVVGANATAIVQAGTAGSNAVVKAISIYGDAGLATINSASNAVIAGAAAADVGIINGVANARDALGKIAGTYGDATIGALAANTNSLINVLAVDTNTLVKSITANGNAIIAGTAAADIGVINSVFSTAAGVIAAIGGARNDNIAITTATANSIVAAIGIGDPISNQILGRLGGIDANEVAWNQNLYNVLADIRDTLKQMRFDQRVLVDLFEFYTEQWVDYSTHDLTITQATLNTIRANAA